MNPKHNPETLNPDEYVNDDVSRSEVIRIALTIHRDNDVRATLTSPIAYDPNDPRVTI
jgi:hypothetical protein